MDMVTITGEIRDPAGTPIENAKILYRIYKYPLAEEKILLTKANVLSRSKEDGTFSIQVPANMVITVVIPSTGFQKTGLTPLEGTINVLDLNENYLY